MDDAGISCPVYKAMLGGNYSSSFFPLLVTDGFVKKESEEGLVILNNSFLVFR